MDWYSKYIRGVELNITELCNYKCVFCPRAYDYPNSNLNMTLDLADLIISQLDQLPHSEAIYFAGRGEPTLHPQFSELLTKFLDYRDNHNPNLHIHIATNGARIDRHAEAMKRADAIKFSIYDETKVTQRHVDDKYREWGNVKTQDRRVKSIELGITDNTYHNRAGSVVHELAKNDAIADPKYGLMCEKPFDVIYVSWNGDYNLCCNDWDNIEVLGNINSESIHEYIHNNKRFKEYQDMLWSGRRDFGPCATCNRSVMTKWVNLMDPYLKKYKRHG